MPNILLLKVVLVAAAVFSSAIFLAVRDGIVAGFSAVVAAILRSPFIVSPMMYVNDMHDSKANPNCLLELGLDWRFVTAAKIKMMIEAGADVNPKDCDGMLLHFAITLNRKAEVISVLIDEGADINAKDNNGNTPLCLAVDYGLVQIVDLLVNAGADVNAKGDLDRIPLHMAVYSGHSQIIPILINAGADVNAIDFFGNTPLHMAAFTENAELAVEFAIALIKAGAYVNLTNGDEKTSLDVADEKGHWEVAAILEKAGGRADFSILSRLDRIISLLEKQRKK